MTVPQLMSLSTPFYYPQQHALIFERDSTFLAGPEYDVPENEGAIRVWKPGLFVLQS
jgi:hypothetical protein